MRVSLALSTSLKCSVAVPASGTTPWRAFPSAHWRAISERFISSRTFAVDKAFLSSAC